MTVRSDIVQNWWTLFKNSVKITYKTVNDFDTKADLHKLPVLILQTDIENYNMQALFFSVSKALKSKYVAVFIFIYQKHYTPCFFHNFVV